MPRPPKAPAGVPAGTHPQPRHIPPSPANAPANLEIPSWLAQQIGLREVQHMRDATALAERVEQLQMKLTIAEHRIAYLEGQLAPSEPEPASEEEAAE
jgi:hypothetical protein